jgi:hypothetical protein
MADIVLDVQSPSATPSAGQIVCYGDTLSKKLQTKDDAGVVDTLAGVRNTSTGDQTGFASDTYLVGSSIAIPSSLVRAKTIYRLTFDMVKTGAGTATFIAVVRFGTAGTVADAARLTFTFGAGTAAIDTGIFEIKAHFRNVGASAVLVGTCRCTHHLAATGLISTGASGTGVLLVTSGAFDSTVASSIIGVSLNGGASFAGTNVLVNAELVNV